MNGAQRESRESEKTFAKILGNIPSLTCSIWYPLPENALEGIDDMIIAFRELREQFIKENPKLNEF